MKTSKQTVHLVDSMGSDLSVVNAARVSFAKESTWYIDPEDGSTEIQDQDARLINYLAKHAHWSPFAHNSLTFRIKAPIFVARQLVKHQVGGVWNEVSRRYVDDEPEFYFPEVWRGKPVNAKQGSDGELENSTKYTNWVKNSADDCLETYLALLRQGVAPEQARMILPQNTMTEWWWTGSLMFFARVCKQRLDPHAQQETREVAQMISEQIPTEFEHSWKALMQ
jgi:thymidylate synthase (FAD)